MNYTKEAGKNRNSRQLAIGSSQRTLLCGLFLLISFSINAQIAGKSIPELQREMNAKVPSLPNSIIPSFQHFSLHPPIFQSSHPPLQAMPKSYNYNNLALFCKIEVKLEKAMKLPIKFRLGEVEYVDRMEGKY